MRRGSLPYVLPTSLDDPDQGAASDRFALVVILRDALARTRLWQVLHPRLAACDPRALPARWPGCLGSCARTSARPSCCPSSPALLRCLRCARDPPAWPWDLSGWTGFCRQDCEHIGCLLAVC